MKQKLIKIISLLTLVFLGSWGTSFAATIILTNTTDTLEVFRTNYNTTVTNLNNALGSSVTSITAGDGLLGGTITTSGTIYGQVGTSTVPVLGQIPYWTGLGTATSPAKLTSIATSSITYSSPLSTSGTAGYIIGGSGFTIGCSTCVTNVTASGNIASSGGTTPAITFTGILPYANGGTNGTGFTSNQLVFANGTSLVSASSTAVTPLGMYLGLGTTTPRWLLQLATSTAPQISLSDGNVVNSHWTLRSVGGNFYLGTSSPTTLATSSPSAFTISNNGQVSATEANIATSTNITVDWNTTPNQVLLRIGASATTIAFNNASTTGMTKRIVVCNPGQTAGAITWNAPVEWAGAAVPTQTTTSNQCDVYSFIVTVGTSTTKVFGAGSTGFN